MRLALLRLFLGYYWVDRDGAERRDVPPWDRLDLCVSEQWLAEDRRKP